MHRSDAELLADLAGGDPEAYAELFRRYVRALTRFAVRRCRTPEDVADAVSDTFLVAGEAAGRYRPEHDSALPWLMGIARRIIFRQRRSLSRRLRLQDRAAWAVPTYSGWEIEAVAAAIDAARQSPELEAALRRLSRAEREVLELVAYDDLTPAEAARVLDLTPNAARLRLSRARRKMRTWLESGGHREVESPREAGLEAPYA